MDPQGVEFLNQFSMFLDTLGEDAAALGDLVGHSELPESTRQILAGGLNYLFKTLDLIPDGIDDIGFLDDAFVLRVVSEQAMAEGVSTLSPDLLRSLNKLAEDVGVVSAFLGDDYSRMERYVKGLRGGTARGRSTGAIVEDAELRAEFLGDLRAFSQRYRPPRFTREEKTLVRLQAFFDAKLPK